MKEKFEFKSEISDFSKDKPENLLLKAILNTESENNPMKVFEEQRKIGRKEFLASDLLPIRTLDDYSGYNSTEILKEAGVIFKEPCKGDEKMFQHATLPAGWKKIENPECHELISFYLLDEKGRRRAELRYDPTSYKRFANMYALNRFSYTFNYDLTRDEVPRMQYQVFDQKEKLIYETEPLAFDSNNQELDAGNKSEQSVYKWLHQNRPGWKSLLSELETFPFTWFRDDNLFQDGKYCMHLFEKGERVYTTEMFPFEAAKITYRSVSEKSEQETLNWLKEHYPDWKNPGAYWD